MCASSSMQQNSTTTTTRSYLEACIYRIKFVNGVAPTRKTCHVRMGEKGLISWNNMVYNVSTKAKADV